MTDEKTQTMSTGTPSKLEEARALAERMEKASNDLKAQADRLEQLKVDAMLSGTGGIRPTINDAKPESNAEYAARMLRGKSGR